MLKIENKGRAQARSRNTIRIFNFIWENGTVSRTEITEQLKISAPSVTRIVESLILGHFVREVGAIKSSMGRKPMKLEVNKNARYTIGINITKSRIHIALVNLGREVMYKKSSPLSVRTGKELMFAVEECISKLLSEKIVDRDLIIGIGIATTGVVNYEEGIIEVWNPQSNIINVPAKSYLEEKFHMMVRLDNNINVLLFGNYWFADKREGEKYQNLVYLYCAEGVGCSIFSEGQIIRGNNSFAGKIGHMTIEDEGKLCTCGRRGCLEAYTSIKGIEEEYFGLESVSKSFYEICSNANQGDRICRQVLFRALTRIAIAVNNINVMLNPEAIMISGDIFEYFNQSAEFLKGEVERRSFHEKLNNFRWNINKNREFPIEFYATALIYDEVLRVY